MIKSIFGEEYDIEEESVDKVKDIVKKAKAVNSAEASVEKQLKSNKLSLEDRLRLIKDQVYEVLKKQKNNVSVITTREALHDYISGAIAFGKIAIDTETNNSLDPLTCKLMGPCFYYPGDKQVYVPINHVNIHTNERLTDQLTEQDIKEELQRLVEAKTFIIMHNGKFDYQVIKCTCGIVLPIDFDTQIAARILNENERAGLKEQYVDKIDSTQEKYSITHLFANIKYELVDPKLFALYAATDSLMTYRLYEWQLNQFLQPGNEKLYNFLFKKIEMPLVPVTAEMELAGVAIDQEYAKRLATKYHTKLDKLDLIINQELANLEPTIQAWRLTPEAVKQVKTYASEKIMKKADFIEKYPLQDEHGYYKLGKSKAEQLKTPINLASPAQLAILLYDVLKCPVVNKEKPNAVGEEELDAIAEQVDLPICNLMIQRRTLTKLLSTYIDNIPVLANNWPDGRVHTHFNQCGTDTGRFSSKDPINLQNITSHNKEIRLLFRAKEEYQDIEETNTYYEVSEISEVETTAGWKFCKDLKIGDTIITDSSNEVIKNILFNNKTYFLYV